VPGVLFSPVHSALKLQGTFGVIQGTFGLIQGTFGLIQGTFESTQHLLSKAAPFFEIP
jgi:hypothetical protein